MSAEQKVMKVWITKYALTTGIFEIEAVEPGERGMIKQTDRKYPTYYHGEGREWHSTRASAETAAAIMRDKKVKSLELQLSKLRSMTFSEPKQ